MEKNWIQEMIERESMPRKLRKETTVAFCERHDIASSSYYGELSKKENQKIILENSLNLAKKYTPDVMDSLGERATKDNKAAELFMNYVLELAKNLDVKSDGKPIYQVTEEIRDKYEINTSTDTSSTK